MSTEANDLSNREILLPQLGLIHPAFELFVQKIIGSFSKDTLADLRSDFHGRLRLTLTQPSSNQLVEDLWDFFYDWCVFEKKLMDQVSSLTQAEKVIWEHAKDTNVRGVFSVARADNDSLKLSELYTGKTYWVLRREKNDFLGIARSDMLEARLVEDPEHSNRSQGQMYNFIRTPTYHPIQVHSYLKKKVRSFRKLNDPTSYGSWMWLLIGMYLKHRLYEQMPIERIYDDQSRI